MIDMDNPSVLEYIKRFCDKTDMSIEEACRSRIVIEVCEHIQQKPLKKEMFVGSAGEAHDF